MHTHTCWSVSLLPGGMVSGLQCWWPKGLDGGVGGLGSGSVGNCGVSGGEEAAHPDGTVRGLHQQSGQRRGLCSRCHGNGCMSRFPWGHVGMWNALLVYLSLADPPAFPVPTRLCHTVTISKARCS